MPSAAFVVADSTNRVIARQAASDTDVSTSYHQQGFFLTCPDPVSVAISTGFWPCCGLPAEFGGCISEYHVEKLDEMEPEGSPKGKGPRASRKSDGKRKISEESAEQGPSKRSHPSTLSTLAPRLRETSTTTPAGNPTESWVDNNLELDPLGQGKVMPPDPNGLMPVHQYEIESHDLRFTEQQDWVLAHPQEWGVTDPLDPWLTEPWEHVLDQDVPEGNVGNDFVQTVEEEELL